LGDNLIESIDLSLNTLLEDMSIQNNLLTELDLSNNILLTSIYVPDNQIDVLVLPEAIDIESLDCSNNNISGLDLSEQISLNGIYCSGNALTYLNVQNGYDLECDFDATNNPDLVCIQVDDAAESTMNWPYIDPTASFSEDCDYCILDLNVSVEGTTLTADIAGLSYQWIDCNDDNQPIIGATEQAFDPEVDGEYAVIITESVTCSDTSNCISILGTGNNLFQNNIEISIYPNPNNGNFFVNLNQLDGAEIIISNILGEQVFCSYLSQSERQVNLSSCSEGVYFYQIKFNSGIVKNGKIVIE
jgi:hypothetical protein